MIEQTSRQQFVGAVGVFYEGKAVFEEDGEWYHISSDGKPAYPQRYKMTEYYQNGFAWVQKHDGTWVKINKKGQEI
jgi:hypothetical protein